MKKRLISIVIAIFVLSAFSVVNAATGSINVGASSDEVKVGDIFTVTVIGTADNNIAGLQAKLSYDKTKLAIEKKTIGEGFSDFSGNDEIAVAASSSETLSKTGTLYTITFKVLDTAKAGETKIDIKDIELGVVNTESKQETITVANESVTIDIEEKVVEPENKEENTPNKPEENTTKNEQVSNKNETIKENEKLPQTGVESVSLIAIVIFAFIGIVSYVSYNKYRNI